jgi:hypothetical protein
MEALITMTAVATSDEPTCEASKADTSERAASALRVKATYLLSEKGRKAALLVGRSGLERQRVKLSVPSHRLHLVTVDGKGIPRLKLVPRYELRKGGHVVKIDALPEFDHLMTPDELLLFAAKNYELEQTWRAQRISRNGPVAEALTRRDEIAQAFLTDKRQRALERPTPNQAWCYLRADDGGRMLFDVTKGSRLSRNVPPEAHRRFQADLRARRRRSLEERTVQAVHHEQKKQFVADWILAHGTPDQQARQRAGLLSMQEALDLISDHLFAPARDFPLYPHDGAAILEAHLRTIPEFADVVITKADLVHTFEDAKAANAAQWARAQEIQRALPHATVTVRFHRLLWRKNLNAPTVNRYGIIAVQTLGPLTLRREYEAGE